MERFARIVLLFNSFGKSLSLVRAREALLFAASRFVFLSAARL